MPLKRKLISIICFGLRSLVIGAAVAQLTLLTKRPIAQDQTFFSWPYYLSTQIVQSLSIITACIPYIKNVLIELESGKFQTGHFNLEILRRKTPRKQSPPSSTRNPNPNPRTEAHVAAGHTHDEVAHRNVVDEAPYMIPHSAQSTANARSLSQSERWDEESHSSQTHFIKQTRGWDVGFSDV
ncbi:MAG: hypothetical protein Q9201_002730 [Fulgogasparrea decipioides]